MTISGKNRISSLKTDNCPFPAHGFVCGKNRTELRFPTIPHSVMEISVPASIVDKRGSDTVASDDGPNPPPFSTFANRLL
jgi:hypothetical protein